MALNLVLCHFRALAEELRSFYIHAIFHIYTQKLLFLSFFCLEQNISKTFPHIKLLLFSVTFFQQWSSSGQVKYSLILDITVIATEEKILSDP